MGSKAPDISHKGTPSPLGVTGVGREAQFQAGGHGGGGDRGDVHRYLQEGVSFRTRDKSLWDALCPSAPSEEGWLKVSMKQHI